MFTDSSGFLNFIEKFNEVYDKVSPFVISNILWALLCIPVITAFPATAAMLYVTNQVIHEKPAGVRVYFEGFRKYFCVSLLWGLVNIIAGVQLYMCVRINDAWQHHASIRINDLHTRCFWKVFAYRGDFTVNDQDIAGKRGLSSGNGPALDDRPERCRDKGTDRGEN